MSELAQRIASLSPEKLALLERQLKRRAAEDSPSRVPSPQPADFYNLPTTQAQEPESIPAQDKLREVEAVLEQHPGIQQAAVLMHNATNGNRRIIAYLVPDQTSASQIWQQLRFEIEDRFADRQWYRLPDGKEIVYLNRSETEFVYREIFAENSYLREGIVLEPGACIFDIGAHIGLFTLFASQQCAAAQIYAFEPIPTIFEILRINTSRHAPRVKLFNIGLADTDGTDTFTYYPHASVLSGRYADTAAEFGTVKACLHTQQRLGVGEVNLSEGEIEELLEARLTTEQFSCPIKTLSQVMHENDIERIDLLKIDVEKSELDVLNGIAEEDWPKIRQLVIEVHDIDSRLQMIKNLLERHGYQLTIEQDSVLTDTGIYNLYAVREAAASQTLPFVERQQSSNANPTWESREQLLADVRQFVDQRLPREFAPTTFRLRSSLPRRPNGDFDYAALSSIEGERNLSNDVLNTARNPIEGQLANIWAEALMLNHFDVQDDFFELGGNSFLAIEVVSRIQNTLNVELSLRSLFENPTIAGLARLISPDQSDRNGNSLSKITNGNPIIEDTLPVNLSGLSNSEVSLWLKRLADEEEKPGKLSAVGSSVSTASIQNEPTSHSGNIIVRAPVGPQQTLLANLDRLSDEDVDYWLQQYLAEEKRAGNPDPTNTNSLAIQKLHQAREQQSSKAIGTAPSGSSQEYFPQNPSASTPPTPISATSRVLFEEINSIFARQLQRIGWDSQKRYGEAYLAYIRDLQEAWIDRAEYRFGEAYFTYMQNLHEAHEEAQTKVAEAYQGYVIALQATWLQIDLDALDPDSLFAIGQSMGMASFSASQVLASSARGGK